MDRKIFRLAILTCTIISVCLGFFTYYYYLPFTTTEYDMHVWVSGTAGFNIDTDKIWFGIIPPGNAGARYLDLNNSYPYPVNVKFSASGDIAKWVSITDIPSNPFILEPNGTKKIRVVVNVPASMNISATPFTGKLKIRSYHVF
jgi:hypothetical protein